MDTVGVQEHRLETLTAQLEAARAELVEERAVCHELREHAIALDAEKSRLRLNGHANLVHDWHSISASNAPHAGHEQDALAARHAAATPASPTSPLPADAHPDHVQLHSHHAESMEAADEAIAELLQERDLLAESLRAAGTEVQELQAVNRVLRRQLDEQTHTQRQQQQQQQQQQKQREHITDSAISSVTNSADNSADNSASNSVDGRLVQLAAPAPASAAAAAAAAALTHRAGTYRCSFAHGAWVKSSPSAQAHNCGEINEGQLVQMSATVASAPDAPAVMFAQLASGAGWVRLAKNGVPVLTYVPSPTPAPAPAAPSATASTPPRTTLGTDPGPSSEGSARRKSTSTSTSKSKSRAVVPAHRLLQGDSSLSAGPSKAGGGASPGAGESVASSVDDHAGAGTNAVAGAVAGAGSPLPAVPQHAPRLANSAAVKQLARQHQHQHHPRQQAAGGGEAGEGAVSDIHSYAKRDHNSSSNNAAHARSQHRFGEQK